MYRLNQVHLRRSMQRLRLASTFNQPPGKCIGGFRRGGRGAMPPSKMPKVALFALHMQCIKNLCSKTNKSYTQYMHFRGFSCPKKRLLSGLRPGNRPLPRKCTFVFGFRPQFKQFLALGGCAPLVAPISGYVCYNVHPVWYRLALHVNCVGRYGVELHV